MILTWLGRIALDLAFLACVAGVVFQVMTLRGRASRAGLFAVLALGAWSRRWCHAVRPGDSQLFPAYVAENNATFTR